MRFFNAFGYSVEAKAWVNRTSDFKNSNTDFYSKDNGPKR